jgi:hypothetical protein
MEKNLSTMSYQDMIKSFKQAEPPVGISRPKKLIYKPVHAKHPSSNLASNKENIPRTHHHSQF